MQPPAFAPAFAPSFAIDSVAIAGRDTPVSEAIALQRPFWRLRRFHARRAGPRPAPVLVASPLSGHYAWLMRDLVLGLLPRHEVLLIDWQDAAEVPAAAGRFGLGDNIAAVVEAVRAVGTLAEGRRPHLVGVSQAPTPVLAASALMAEDGDPLRPRSAILMGGFIDTRTSANGVTRLVGTLGRSWFRDLMAAPVPLGRAGAGRRVWPAWVQGGALARYMARHLATGGEVGRKLMADDGADPAHFPFLQLFSTLMDLPAELVEENVAAAFLDHALATGRLHCGGRRVDPAAIADIGLMTIEGGEDDSSGPGHTDAAHALCPRLPDALRARHHEPTAGHFGLFHGEAWRLGVLPRLEAFLQTMEAGKKPRRKGLDRKGVVTREKPAHDG